MSAAYTVVLPHLVDVAGGDDADRAEWVPVYRVGDLGLAFDHARILSDALTLANSNALNPR